MEKLFKSVFLPVQALKNARTPERRNAGTPEPGMLRSLVPVGISAICIGANVGDFMRRLRLCAAQGQHHPLSVCPRRAMAGSDRLAGLNLPIRPKSKLGGRLAHIGDETDLAMRLRIQRGRAALFPPDEIMVHLGAHRSR